MKKKIILLSLLLMSLSSCGIFDFGGSSDTSNDKSNVSTSTEDPFVPIVISTEPITLTIRTEETTITDSGRKNQKMDVLLLSNYFDVKEAYKSGYTKLHVTLSLDVKELYNGYQYVFLYADRECKSNTFFDKVVDEFYDPEDPSLLYEYRFEHTSGKKDTTWWEHSFTTTLKMNRLIDDLYIRYGASGEDEDTWLNRNVVVTFQVEK